MDKINRTTVFGYVSLNEAIDQMGRKWALDKDALDGNPWPLHGWVEEKWHFIEANGYDLIEDWPARGFNFIRNVAESAREVLQDDRVKAVYMNANGETCPIPASAWGRMGVDQSIARNEPLELLDDNGDAFHVYPQIPDGRMAKIWRIEEPEKRGTPKTNPVDDRENAILALKYQKDALQEGRKLDDTASSYAAIEYRYNHDLMENRENFADDDDAKGSNPRDRAKDRCRRLMRELRKKGVA